MFRLFRLLSGSCSMQMNLRRRVPKCLHGSRHVRNPRTQKEHFRTLACVGNGHRCPVATSCMSRHLVDAENMGENDDNERGVYSFFLTVADKNVIGAGRLWNLVWISRLVVSTRTRQQSCIQMYPNVRSTWRRWILSRTIKNHDVVNWTVGLNASHVVPSLSCGSRHDTG